MESRAKLFGHPVHQMLVVFPLGLLVMGVLFDIIYKATGGELVDRLGVGVDPDAHLDAPNSLSGRPARQP